MGSISKLSEKCKDCAYVETCGRKRMEMAAYLVGDGDLDGDIITAGDGSKYFIHALEGIVEYLPNEHTRGLRVETMKMFTENPIGIIEATSYLASELAKMNPYIINANPTLLNTARSLRDDSIASKIYADFRVPEELINTQKYVEQLENFEKINLWDRPILKPIIGPMK